MKKILATFALLGIVAAAANAQVILSESFSYANGSLAGQGPWTTTLGTPGEQNVVSGELFLSDDESEDTIASFSTAATSAILSATFNLRNDTDISTSAGGSYFTHFVSSGGGDFARVFTSSSPGGATDDYRLGIATTTGTPVFFGPTFTAGTNYTLTLSYNFSTDLASLSIAGFGTVTATDVVDVANINRYAFRQTTTTGDQFIDNLVVNIVPEPATYMLLGVGLLVCAQRLRRKHS